MTAVATAVILALNFVSSKQDKRQLPSLTMSGAFGVIFYGDNNLNLSVESIVFILAVFSPKNNRNRSSGYWIWLQSGLSLNCHAYAC